MWLGSQSEETLLCIREQPLSRGASQSAVRRRWLSLCTVCPSHSHWPNEHISFITTMRLPILHLSCRLLWRNITSPRSCHPPYGPDLAPCYFWLLPKPKSPLKGRDLWMRRSPVHKLSQRLLTADWLAPRKSDCSLMNIKVSSDWLPSYIKATRPVLEIFKWLDTFWTALVLLGESRHSLSHSYVHVM
jgi:hypothetical protein